MPENGWHFQSGGQVHGPFSSEELQERAASGEILSDTPVCQGGAEWCRADSLTFLAPSFGRPRGEEGGGHSPESASTLFPSGESVAPKPRMVPATAETFASLAARTGSAESIPYGLIFAWVWTIFIGYVLCVAGHFDRVGPPALDPRELLVQAAYLVVPILLLVVPTLPIALGEWRRKKSPAAGLLIGVIVAIIVVFIVQRFQRPEWSARNTSGPAATREEANEAIRWMTEYMDSVKNLGNAYQRELTTVGWSTILAPSRLRNDKTLTQSRGILSKAKELVQRYRARASSEQRTAISRIHSLRISSSQKEQMLQAADRSAKEWQPKNDRIWDLEEKCLGEVENILNLLEARPGAWEVVGDEIAFQNGEDLQRFNAYLANVQRYAAEREQIQKQAANAVKSLLADAPLGGRDELTKGVEELLRAVAKPALPPASQAGTSGIPARRDVGSPPEKVAPSHRPAGKTAEGVAFTSPKQKSAEARFLRGTAYAHEGNFDKAIAEYAEAVRLDPGYAEAYYYRGVAYQGKGERDKANLDFDQAKKLGFKPQ